MDLPIHISDWPGNLGVQSIGINLKSEGSQQKNTRFKDVEEVQGYIGSDD